jgi:hypothetical protein
MNSRLMRKITFFLFLMLPINSFANDSVDCHSANSDVGDSAYWAEKSIDLFAKNKFEQAVKTVDACFGLFSYAAVVMQKDFNAKNSKAPPSGKVNRKEKKKIYANWAVNDVSVALWAKARSLEEMGNIELAKIAYSQCIFLSHGRAWDPKGWFWVPANDCAKRGRKLIE